MSHAAELPLHSRFNEWMGESMYNDDCISAQFISVVEIGVVSGPEDGFMQHSIFQYFVLSISLVVLWKSTSDGRKGLGWIVLSLVFSVVGTPSAGWCFRKTACLDSLAPPAADALGEGATRSVLEVPFRSEGSLTPDRAVYTRPCSKKAGGRRSELFAAHLHSSRPVFSPRIVRLT